MESKEVNDKEESPKEGEASQKSPSSSKNIEGEKKDPRPQKRKKVIPKDTPKKRCQIWDHFTRLESNNDRAACNYCGQNYAAASEASGTSNLWNHLEKLCKKNPYLAKQGQTTLDKFKAIKKEDDNSSSMKSTKFNHEELRNQLAKMCIIDEFPFRIVEGEGFQKYSKALEPRFVIPSHFTVARDCMSLYHNEKKLLKETLKSYRLFLTTDTWTSIQNLNYMCLTAHWIGNDWKLHKRIISFSQVANHKGETLGKRIEDSLLEWGIDKIFTITIDNASSNDGAIRYLKRRTKEWKETILYHDYLDVRCCAHIMNLIVRDGLEEQNDSIVKIRNAIRYVRSSPSRLESFKKCVEKEKIESKSLVCLDVETRWNSTLMLECAEKFEKAFVRLEEDDPTYLMYFDCNEENDLLDEGNSRKSKSKVSKHLSPPTFVDWENARWFVKFLRLFYNVTLKFSGSLYVTSNCFFRELVVVQTRLEQLSKIGEASLRLMASRMQSKFDKYWGNLENMNIMLFVAIVLDPQYKMKYVKFFFNQLHGVDGYKTKYLLEKIETCLNQLYDLYANDNTKEGTTVGIGQNLEGLSYSMDIDDFDDTSKFLESQFTKHLEEEQSVETKSEITRYLMDACKTNSNSFEILEWWKLNSDKYSVLSQVARDVLEIQVSTIASESAFSISGHILDPFRSSLSPKMVEALLCCQNWLRSSPCSLHLKDVMDQVEKYKELEKDFSSPSPSN